MRDEGEVGEAAHLDIVDCRLTSQSSLGSHLYGHSVTREVARPIRVSYCYQRFSSCSSPHLIISSESLLSWRTMAFTVNLSSRISPLTSTLMNSVRTPSATHLVTLEGEPASASAGGGEEEEEREAGGAWEMKEKALVSTTVQRLDIEAYDALLGPQSQKRLPTSIPTTHRAISLT